MLMSDPFNLKLISSKIWSFSFSYLCQLKKKKKTQGTKLWLWFDFKVKFEKKINRFKLLYTEGVADTVSSQVLRQSAGEEI